MIILFTSSEAYPLIKTGGLADVSSSLPRALKQMKQDVRLIVPAYRSLLQQTKNAKEVGRTSHYELDIRILQTTLPGTRVVTWLVDCPSLFNRAGNPYLNEKGVEWNDNAFRFAVFNHVIVDIALNRLDFDWTPDLVHCNDWQTGLVPALLSPFVERPATVFTVHNLAYQGTYDKQTFIDLGLPSGLWSVDGVEFHDRLSFIKGGLSYADCINTVSPQYAKEIQSKKFGSGLEGLFRHRADRLSGIMNGIDIDVWNPGRDNNLIQKYNRQSLAKKSANKLALQKSFALTEDESLPLCGMISRLVEQKGIDLIIKKMPKLVKMPLQMVFLGSGQAEFESVLLKWAKKYPHSIAVKIGYDEQLAHQIEAASDLFLMPSLFEPCGLNQLYSLRYGTIPLVTNVGGLADSVTDYAGSIKADNPPTGFVFNRHTGKSFMLALKRALDLYGQPDKWKKLQLNGMQQDFSWTKSAAQYLQLYKRALKYSKAVDE